MNLIVPIGLLVCSALWLKGLRFLWQRALLLASLLGLLFALLPALSQDRSLVNLAIYQREAMAFATSVAAQMEAGDPEGARRRLLYFAKNQDWSTANDSDALQVFYKHAELASQSSAASSAQPALLPATK